MTKAGGVVIRKGIEDPKGVSADFVGNNISNITRLSQPICVVTLFYNTNTRYQIDRTNITCAISIPTSAPMKSDKAFVVRFGCESEACA